MQAAPGTARAEVPQQDQIKVTVRQEETLLTQTLITDWGHFYL